MGFGKQAILIFYGSWSHWDAPFPIHGDSEIALYSSSMPRRGIITSMDRFFGLLGRCEFLGFPTHDSPRRDAERSPNQRG